MYSLSLAKKLITPDGKISEQKPQIIAYLGNTSAIEKLKDLLERVTLNGSGKYAKTRGYRIGGKTGSAFIPYKDKKGYSSDVINNYIALFPLSQPKFIIYTRIDKPNQGLALVTTVPLTKKIVDFLINYYSLEPDDEKALISQSE